MRTYRSNSVIIICLLLLCRSAAGSNEQVDTSNAWILQQPPGNYTIQAFASTDKTSSVSFIERNELKDSMHLFTSVAGASKLYKGMYRSYPSRPDAEQGKIELERRLPASGFWIRKFSDLIDELNHQTRSIVDTKSAGGGLSKQFSTLEKEQFGKGQRAFNKQNYETALHHWGPLAEKGMPEAQYGVGFMYESGWGVPRDHGQAFRWYAKAAEHGHAKAQFNLGVLYSLGLGVDKDPVLGRYWIDLSAKNQDKRALDYVLTKGRGDE